MSSVPSSRANKLTCTPLIIPGSHRLTEFLCGVKIDGCRRGVSSILGRLRRRANRRQSEGFKRHNEAEGGVVDDGLHVPLTSMEWNKFMPLLEAESKHLQYMRNRGAFYMVILWPGLPNSSWADSITCICQTMDLEVLLTKTSERKELGCIVSCPPQCRCRCGLCIYTSFRETELWASEDCSILVFEASRCSQSQLLRGKAQKHWVSSEEQWLRVSGDWKLKHEIADDFAIAKSLDSSKMDLEVREVSPNRVDFDIIRDWMDYCFQFHDSICQSRGSSARGLRLIHCESRQVVLAQHGDTYAALSYVWGEQRFQWDSELSGKLPLSLPQTIEDALFVALKLGFEYLWIDRYCIPQGHDPQRSEQIKVMHQIFENADVTIIAATGDDPSCGLPGVSRPRDTGQRVFSGRSQRIVSVEGAPVRDIEGSVWNTRGWTFQEGELSIRRLVFTKSQVFFQCKRAAGCECTDSIRSNGFEPDQQSGSLTGSFFEAILSSESIWTAIDKFCHKKLRYKSDTLNAMLGILEKCVALSMLSEQDISETGSRCFRHLSGLPLSKDHDHSTDQERTWERAIFAALHWSVVNKAWIEPPPLTRNACFPSWCWTGWRLESDFGGPILDSRSQILEIMSSTQSDFTPKLLALEDHDHNLLAYGQDDIEGKVQDANLTLSSDVRFLKVSVAVLDIKHSIYCEQLGQTSTIRMYWRLDCSSCSKVQFHASIDSQSGSCFLQSAYPVSIPSRVRTEMKGVSWLAIADEIFKCLIFDAKLRSSSDNTPHEELWQEEEDYITALLVRGVEKHFQRLALVYLSLPCVQSAKPTMQEILLG